MICVGDSLTLGMIGHSYIDYYKPARDEELQSPGGTLKALNKGVNGDTTRCAFERLEKYLAKPSYDQHETYVIAIGTNDILLPYLARLSSVWKTETSLRCRMKKCISEDEIFRQEYEKYFLAIENYNTSQCAKATGGEEKAGALDKKAHLPKKMITIGLPHIQLKDYPLDTVIRHNEIIRQLSEKHGVPYIDMYSIQCDAAGYSQGVWDELVASGKARTYTWKHKNIIRLIDNLAMLVFPSIKDNLSKSRGLKLTVDGVHYNSFSAKLLGETLSKTQAQYPKGAGRQE